jgi:NADPH2:quinone reductase
MKALLCKTLNGRAEDLVVEDVPGPEPQGDEIVVRVMATGLNFFDTLIIAGKYQYRPALPFSPGAEISGIVARVGREVRGFREGDRVMAFTGWGGARDEVSVRASRAVAMPASVGFEPAAAMQVTYGTGFHALKDRAGLKSGETLVVLGAAGGTGQAAIEIGKRMGARVIAVASNDEKLTFCKSIGADETISSTSEDVRERIKTLTQGRGAEVIYDPVGGALSEPVFRAIGWSGRHLVIGFASGDIPRLPLNLALLKGAALVGVFWGEHVEREPELHRKNMATLIGWLAEGLIRPHVDRSFPLEEAAKAFAAIGRREIMGKAVLRLA